MIVCQLSWNWWCITYQIQFARRQGLQQYLVQLQGYRHILHQEQFSGLHKTMLQSKHMKLNNLSSFNGYFLAHAICSYFKMAIKQLMPCLAYLSKIYYKYSFWFILVLLYCISVKCLYARIIFAQYWLIITLSKLFETFKKQKQLCLVYMIDLFCKGKYKNYLKVMKHKCGSLFLAILTFLLMAQRFKKIYLPEQEYLNIRGGGNDTNVLTNCGQLNSGGRPCNIFSGEEILHFETFGQNPSEASDYIFELESYTDMKVLLSSPILDSPEYILAKIPFIQLSKCLLVAKMSDMVTAHGFKHAICKKKAVEMRSLIEQHDIANCKGCTAYVCVLHRLHGHMPMK